MDFEKLQVIFDEVKQSFKVQNYYKVINLLESLNIPDTYGDLYSGIRINLGIAHEKLGNIDKAEEIYSSVKMEHSVNFYLHAQLYLGSMHQINYEYQKARAAYKNIKLEDSKQMYAKSQFNLAVLCEAEYLQEEAKEHYRNIRPEYDVEQYSKALVNLGHLLQDTNCSRRALSVYKEVKKNQSRNQYIRAQWNIGQLYLDERKYDLFFNQIDYLESIGIENFRDIQYEINIYKQISKSNFKIDLINIYRLINELLNLLRIKGVHEDKVAHYCSPSVAYKILNHQSKRYEQLDEKNKYSLFRLNPDDFMNDPTEGRIIYKFFKIDNLIAEKDCEIYAYKAFIGCFTLHYDSLNQFRLYGKENQKEASGLSLVLKRDRFFLIYNRSFINKGEILPNQSNQLDISQAENNNQNTLDEAENNNRMVIDEPEIFLKLCLYRCIYFDPESGLINLAHREKWTFCREEEKPDSENWKKYKEQIDQITSKVRNLLELIKNGIQEILVDAAYDENILEILDEILLPLRYLIKHYAFKEEQECRVMYITSLKDPRVKFDEVLKRLYVDYENILPALYKIYVSKGAEHHISALQYLGENSPYGKFTVKKSHNPFRC